MTAVDRPSQPPTPAEPEVDERPTAAAAETESGLPLDLYYRLNTICLDMRDLALIQARDHVAQSVKTA